MNKTRKNNKQNKTKKEYLQKKIFVVEMECLLVYGDQVCGIIYIP